MALTRNRQSRTSNTKWISAAVLLNWSFDRQPGTPKHVLYCGDFMPDTQTCSPAQQLAATNKAHFPNESSEYRTARNALLAEEIELRRHMELVASSTSTGR